MYALTYIHKSVYKIEWNFNNYLHPADMLAIERKTFDTLV